MCFSAEADLVMGAGITLVGIDTMRHVDRPAERLLAALPLVLGTHQLVESVAWLGLEGHVGEPVWRAAVWIYLSIAFGVVPVLVPLAVGALEPVSNRPRIAVFTSIGLMVAIVLMYAVARGPVEASIEGRHIAYRVDLWHGGVIVALYVFATCGSLIASAHRHVRWFGVANLLAAGALAWLDQVAFISLWCAWAAITSMAIAIHLRLPGGTEHAPQRQLAT
jgi:hypothetical protein